MMKDIYTDVQLMEYIQQIGFLPLLDSGIMGFSAEAAVADDCRYVVLPDGGWDWPMWKWKGAIVRDGRCAYGKFFASKAGYVSMEWWPDLYNYRRSRYLRPEEGSIEDTILQILSENESLITRDLRKACGFVGANMRSRFDSYVTRLQMGCYIVTEDFVYPRDRHNREYGWGWALLTTPERLFGAEACQCERSAEQSFERMLGHLRRQLPQATDRQLRKLIG